MWPRSIDYVIAVLGLGGHMLLFAMLISRKLAMRLPLFAILIAFYLLRSWIFFLGHLTAVSAPVYWTLIGLDPVLQLMLYIAIMHAWRLSGIKWRTTRSLAGFGVWAVAVAFAGLAAWYIGPSSHYSPKNLAIKAGVFASLLWIEAGVAVLVAARGGARHLPRLTRAVVWGFAIYSVANVFTEIGHTHYAALREALPYLGASYIRIAVYLLCLASWITAVLREPKISSTAT